MTTQLNQLTELTVTSDDDLILIREDSTGVDKRMKAQNIRAKATTKGDVGLGNVPNLDTTNAVNKAHDQNTDTALAQGTGNQVTASEARSHIDATNNPHSVTKAQVGLSNVDNVSAADLRDRSTHTGTQAATTVNYDNAASGLVATDVQAAIDELEARPAVEDADQVNYDNTASGLTATDVQAAIDELEARPAAEDADQITYDNAASGLVATDVQAAIDEVQGGLGTIATQDADDVAITGGTVNADTLQQDGSQAYVRDNILGTVSESSGIPTGAIIQRGSNANGDFVRYADGTQICYRFKLSTTGRSSGIINSVAFTNYLVNWTFPAAFVASGEQSASVVCTDPPGPSNSSLDFIAGPITDFTSLRTTSGSFGIAFRQASSFYGTTNAAISITYIGRWF